VPFTVFDFINPRVITNKMECILRVCGKELQKATAKFVKIVCLST
jgi:hypothetical protein